MRVNTSWAFAGNAVYAGGQWAVLVLLVNALSPAEVGRYAYALAVTSPIFVLASVRLRHVLATSGRIARRLPRLPDDASPDDRLCAVRVLGDRCLFNLEPRDADRHRAGGARQELRCRIGHLPRFVPARA